MPPTFILASRGSALAMTQSRWVKAEVERLAGARVEILEIRTTGDRMQREALPEIGGKGLFTKEIEEALLEGRAQFAVHSLKDLPTEIPPGLALAAVPRREDVRDALISRSGRPLAELPAGPRIGTSSIRRAAQLRRLRPDARIEPLRGNLDTRLRKLREGPLDAIVLAAAGLRRLGLAEQITECFPETALCPAVGQGALGIEARSDDKETLAALSRLEDPEARVAVTAERALLEGLGGGCQIPIAASVQRQDGRLSLTGVVIRPDGEQLFTATETVPMAEDGQGASRLETAKRLGVQVAGNLRRQGAEKILQEVLRSQGSATSPRP